MIFGAECGVTPDAETHDAQGVRIVAEDTGHERLAANQHTDERAGRRRGALSRLRLRERVNRLGKEARGSACEQLHDATRWNSR